MQMYCYNCKIKVGLGSIIVPVTASASAICCTQQLVDLYSC